jgi:hypothetical protein
MNAAEQTNRASHCLMLQKVFSVVCVLCLLAGCSSLPSEGVTPVDGDLSAENTWPSDEAKFVLDAIAFAQRTASAPVEEQRKEMSAAAKAFTRDRSVAARLRYGLLLSLPTLAGADAHRALATLEPLSASGAISPVRQLAILIVAQISERLKELRRAQLLREQLDESRASERLQVERTAQLKAQLDELRAIERALIERRRPKL